MQRIQLLRLTSSDAGTFGKISLAGVSFATGELPWRDVDGDQVSDLDTSCIPCGIYPAKVTWSPRFQRDLYELAGVPGRSSIRIHPANFMGDKAKGFRSDLQGCIALGRKLGRIDGQAAVLDSRGAIHDFMQLLNGQPFELEVKQLV